MEHVSISPVTFDCEEPFLLSTYVFPYLVLFRELSTLLSPGVGVVFIVVESQLSTITGRMKSTPPESIEQRYALRRTAIVF